MTPKDGQFLFHGSYAGIEQVDLAQCSDGKDFGRGFYLTSDEAQARRFVRLSLRKAIREGRINDGRNYGFVSVFRFRTLSSMNVYTFETANHLWLQFVAMNRLDKSTHFEYPALLRQISGCDLIIGKVANDQTNATITAYLSGAYGDLDDPNAISFAVSRLRTDRLTDQFCFRSEHGIQALECMEVYRYDV